MSRALVCRDPRLLGIQAALMAEPEDELDPRHSLPHWGMQRVLCKQKDKVLPESAWIQKLRPCPGKSRWG